MPGKDDTRFDLFSHDAEQIQKWRNTPDKEKQDHIALNLIKINDGLRKGDRRMENHENRIVRNEQFREKVTTACWFTVKLLGLAGILFGLTVGVIKTISIVMAGN